jgi:hypothetical protein
MVKDGWLMMVNGMVTVSHDQTVAMIQKEAYNDGQESIGIF